MRVDGGIIVSGNDDRAGDMIDEASVRVAESPFSAVQLSSQPR